MKLRLTALALLLLTSHNPVSICSAQLVADGATNTLSNVTNNITGSVTIGTNNAFTLLVLSDNTLLTNSVNGVIGRNATAKSNEVRLLSATARWQMGGSLFVGSNGALSTLVVSNGAYLESNEGHLAYNAASSNNSAVITGAGSVWSNRSDLFIGGAGRNNQMIVSNGGWVASGLGVLGRQAGSSNNLVFVTGSGSVWSNTLDLFVGSATSGNQLMIAAGGLVSCDEGYVGISTAANNNEVLVTGPGSLWQNRSFTTYIGLSGSFNRLVVSNGAAATSPGVIVGAAAFCVSNQVVVTGAGSTWSNLGMTIGSGTSSHRVDVSAGGRILTRKATVGYLGFNNTVFVKDSGSAWNDQGDLIIGDIGSGNMVIASNGATVVSSNAILGAVSAPGFGPGDSNVAVITGIGTLWSNRFECYVGAQGSGNQLIVSNSAALVSSNLSLGLELSSSGNLLEVTGPNAALNNQGGVFVGASGAANQMNASAGAQVFNSKTTVGVGVSSSNNTLLVTGAGTSWITVNGLAAGESGPNNRVVISNSATLYAGDGDIGVNSSSRSNSITVTDAGSTLIVPGVLRIGNNSPFNRLVITNGARVDRGLCHLGSSASGSNNLVIVTGPGTVWTNMTALVVGVSTGGRNQFLIRDGGKVYVGEATISLNPAHPLFGFQPNELVVEGNNSLLRCTNSLSVGFTGNGSWLTVSSNATVQAGTFINVGANGSTNSLLTVAGGTLQVTNPASTGTLNIMQGTNVFNAGLIAVDQLWMTNALGRFVFHGGTLQTRNTTVSNQQTFLVGDGSSPATLSLNGGTHIFTPMILVGTAASVVGNGTLIGPLLLNGGSTLSPGPALGKISLSNSPVLSGEVIMEISKSGSGLTNDHIEVAASLTFSGGSLVVSNLGPSALGAGDRFQLFSATSYSGLLSSLTLPTLPSGLEWTNKLLVDGSIEVVTAPVPRDFGVDVSHFQNESGIPQASWDQMFAAGKRFVFVKATEGLTGPHDATMALNVQRAAAAGLLVGVYHFAHPENRPTTNGAILEASNLVVYAGSAIGPGRLRPVLDLEFNAVTLSTTALTDWAIAFCNEIVARRGLSAAPIIYCDQSFANNEFDSRLADYDLWLRTVGTAANPAVDEPPGMGFADATGVFNNWSFWQYSASGNSGGISPLDLNVCHSEFKPLASFLITNVVPTAIELTGLSVSASGAFQLSFTNQAGATFTVLAATNLTLPLSNWTVLGAVAQPAPGQFQFSDLQATNHPQRFYRVRSP
jgi:T5SS/PEP-CTERM-associated repeat protein